MPLDLGRITHLLEQMHRSEDDAGDPIPEGMHLVTDGARGFTWEDSVTAGSIDAVDVQADSSVSGAGSENVQGQLDELYGVLGWSVDSVGTLTPDGSPQTIINDAFWNEFPGAVRLDASRVLLVYRGLGTDHETDGEVCGQILTLGADHASITDVGTRFSILADTEDLRVEDGVSIIDDQIVVAFRFYDGADNHDPSIIICDDSPTDFTASSTWGAPIALPDPGGSVQKYTQGYVHKLDNGSYLLGGGFDSGGNHTVGVWKWTGTVDDPSAASFVTVGSGGNDYAEIAIEETSPGNLVALLRSVTNTDIDKATSADSGATWSAVGAGFDGYGYPMFRKLLSGLVLTVYRDAPNGDTAWRSSTDDGATWSSETILDTTGTRSAYATLLQTTPNAILCPYAIEYSSGGTTGTADIFYQWFADSSTFGASITAADEKVKVSSNDTTAGYLNGKLVAGTNITLTENNDGSNETLTIAASGGGSTHWEPVIFDNAGTPEIVYFQDSGGVWDIVMHEVSN